MDVRTGRRLRVGEALLAVGLTRMTRTSPLAYVVGRAAMRAVRMRLLERCAWLRGDGRFDARSWPAPFSQRRSERG